MCNAQHTAGTSLATCVGGQAGPLLVISTSKQIWHCYHTPPFCFSYHHQVLIGGIFSRTQHPTHLKDKV